ncbi:acetyltransferase [Pochonia chlamydosporia 170]|uniref:Acetyltransferase n=1 Tax=Pochonia chlamydosporia 170 TaxID=1380566 RepID=A0A179FP41_METCM|nr:acetyltransferase [Pochonia chlamydosporia 170]OAQ67127.1 acetyltransferase [Pochonia chlamydosporia 170]
MADPDFITNAYKSERLIYRAMEENHHDRAWVSEFILNDSEVTVMGTPRLARPAPLTDAQSYIDHNKGNLLNALICLPPDTATSADDRSMEPIPIGDVSLIDRGVPMMHHRNAMISINIIAPYRGKGYGGEAINWALDWGFRRAGLHRIAIGVFSYNVKALHLYKKLGFVEEGREREALLLDRRWYDGVILGMLEGEWEKLRGLKGDV